jgi:hypothetical protein
MTYKILEFNHDHHFFIWDKFVFTSINGTIFHTRKFLNYHPTNRFIDTSILIYKNNKLVSVLPCCKNNDKYFSHKGATYGGTVFSNEVFNIKDLKTIIDLIFEYYQNKIEFRIANTIYFFENTDSLLYLLSRKTKMSLELAWYIHVDKNIIESIKNVRNKQYLINIVKGNEYSCCLYNDDVSYSDYYNILSNNLQNKHNATPTHSLDELIRLKNSLGDKMGLFLVKDINGLIYSGIIFIKVTCMCWYTIYISKNIDTNKPNQTLLLIVSTMQKYAKAENVTYIDFGITTENQGSILNIGLSYYKESSFSGSSSNRYLFLMK